MTIQTNPEVFNPSLPVHTVTHIDRATGIVILSGSDATLLQVPLNPWGLSEWSQPLIGSKVQKVDKGECLSKTRYSGNYCCSAFSLSVESTSCIRRDAAVRREVAMNEGRLSPR
jgi:hypothetical protein